MNVVFLSDHGSQGGAAVAAKGVIRSIMHGNLDDVFHHITFFKDDIEVAGLHPLWYEETDLKRQFYRLPRKLLPGIFSRPHTPEFAARRLRAKLAELRPDLINVHNLHAASPWGWGPHLVEVCLEFAPVVWTLHDMWSFTGRCAYSYDCRKFMTGCDASCPTPTEAPALAPEKIRAAWEERRGIYARHQSDLVIVTPSRWLADEARAGFFAQHRVEVIPYGLPLSTHSPYPFAREDARRALGINPAGPVLLIAAFDLTERRKGADILPRLWPHIPQRPLTILTMGKGTIVIDDPLIEVHALGFLDDDRRKALAYSAADALLHPAPVDNFPNIVLEALASGTPTIALPIGGLPELVRPGVSGWLAEAANPEALGQAVERAVQDLAQGKNLRESCRALAEKEYSLELQGRRYFQLFRELRRR
jgi:glycosyltransferase involved in cell wall biosynthesis